VSKRKNRPKIRKRAPVQAAAVQDGYSNPAAFLGEASPLFSGGEFVRSAPYLDFEELTVLYRESWLAMRIIDMPSEDMTRAWYRFSSPVPEEDQESLRRLEAKHSIRRELTDAIRWARLYGGSLALMVLRGEEDRLSEPLDMDLLLPGCFRGLLVLDRAQGIEPSEELEEDLDDPDFGLPKYYSVELDDLGTVRLHHSRVLRFAGRELPRAEARRESWWGAGEMEHIMEELQKRSAASANIAQLIFQANITTLKISDFGDALAMGTEAQKHQIRNAVMEENRFRTSFGLQILSAGDTLENHPYSFGGLSEIYEQFMLDMAGAAEIPAAKLFGRAPAGLNATGESDLKNYYESISQLQERLLRPALEKLLPVLALSAWGTLPGDMAFVFNPIAAESPAETAELVDKLSTSVIEAFRAGLLTREEARAELRIRGSPYGMWQNQAR
jgi:phage-related protein (TIGR01555 family)